MIYPDAPAPGTIYLEMTKQNSGDNPDRGGSGEPEGPRVYRETTLPAPSHVGQSAPLLTVTLQH
jgi:hypothetical protein